MTKVTDSSITVCIPCYEMKGKGAEYLKRCLESVVNTMEHKVYKNVDIVVSDNSDDHDIKKVVDEYSKQINITHIKNPIRGASANYNCALRHAKGNYVRFLAQDDWLAHDWALKCPPTKEQVWKVDGANDNREPVWTGDIHLGNNKLGGPSCLTILREKTIEFDESLTWLFDCDMYRRLYDLYGEPCIPLNGVNYNVGTGEHQLTNILSDEIKRNEELTLRRRYV